MMQGLDETPAHHSTVEYVSIGRWARSAPVRTDVRAYARPSLPAFAAFATAERWTAGGTRL
jgi:hypothetical protein